MEYDYLDGGGNLAVLSVGCRRPGSVFRLGVAGNRPATEHHGDELGTMTNNLDHERYMRRAIELAAHVPDLPFGAVL